MQLCVSSDMLVEGRHFLSTVAPQRLGHKALAVNLSDLAACGAEPLAFTLALALPRADEVFLQGFAEGLWALAERHGIELVGGDTTAGPLNICITVIGQVPAGQALLRSGARAGDELWVSGTLGDARAALEVFRGTLDAARRRLRDAAPRDGAAASRASRWASGCAAWPAAPSTSATACSATWAMCCAAPAVGARLDVDALPRSAQLAALPRGPCSANACCTAATTTSCCSPPPPARHDAVLAAAREAGVPVQLHRPHRAGHGVGGDRRPRPGARGRARRLRPLQGMSLPGARSTEVLL